MNKEIWKNVENLNPNLLLCHARGASTGSGSPKENTNNHPFVVDDLSIALIHNGRVPNKVCEILKNKYQVHTSCDSEILLRIIQSQKTILEGIEKIWSLAYESHMAVVIGEFYQNKRELYIFRNEHRTAFCVDLIDSLGQIFFVSTDEIWKNSIKNIDLKYKIEEVPPEEVWHFTSEEFIELNKYSVKSEGLENWKLDDFVSFNKPIILDNIYTNLDSNEQYKNNENLENYNKSKSFLYEIINNLYEIEGILEQDQTLDFNLLLIKLSLLEKEVLNILKIIKI